MIRFNFIVKYFVIQTSFKNESLILKWKDDSNENLIFSLFYKHENDENWSDVILKHVPLDKGI